MLTDLFKQVVDIKEEDSSEEDEDLPPICVNVNKPPVSAMDKEETESVISIEDEPCCSRYRFVSTQSIIIYSIIL